MWSPLSIYSLVSTRLQPLLCYFQKQVEKLLKLCNVSKYTAACYSRTARLNKEKHICITKACYCIKHAILAIVVQEE